MPILLSLRLARILGLFLIILNLGGVGFPPSQMYPASSELADGSRVGPGKVDSFLWCHQLICFHLYNSDTLGWRVCCYMVGNKAVKRELG